MSKSREEMHDKFIELGEQITCLKGIVQNYTPEEEQLEQWINLMDQQIIELHALKRDVIWFFQYKDNS